MEDVLDEGNIVEDKDYGDYNEVDYAQEDGINLAAWSRESIVRSENQISKIMYVVHSASPIRKSAIYS